MSYHSKLAAALDYNKTRKVVFYGMLYQKGDLIKFEDFMNGKTDSYKGGAAKCWIT